MGIDVFSRDIRERYELLEWRHACSVLAADFADEKADLEDVLRSFQLTMQDFANPGGNLSPITRRLDHEGLRRRGWSKKRFDTEIRVDQVPRKSPTHEVDCFKGRVAVEVEWNNKDPFYDRDLNNFRLLFDLDVVSVGVIITKSQALVPLVQSLGREVWKKYGRSTTWMEKLLPRIKGGGGGGCPLLAIGITDKCVTDWSAERATEDNP